MSSISEIQCNLSHLDISGLRSQGKYENTFIHWHFMDISQNYFNDRIDWENKGIELMDDKYFTMYNVENMPYLELPENTVDDILNFNNATNLIVKDVIYYFKEVYIQKFKDIILSFLKWDKNPDKFSNKISKINNMKDFHFIIVPTGKYKVDTTSDGLEKTVISFAIINTNSKLMKYFKSGSSYKNIENKKQYRTSLMLNLVSGLTNHYTITGILNTSSFNLCKAFIKHFQTKKCLEEFEFRFNSDCNIYKKVPLCHVLQNMNAYFPKIQVIWTSLKYSDEQLFEILNSEESNYNFKKHDVLFKHLNEYNQENDRQKRWAKRFYPYTKNKHINDEKNILERRKKRNIKKQQTDKNVKSLTDKEFLKKLSMVDITTSND